MSLQVAKKIKAYPFTIFEILFLKYTRQFYIGIGNIGHFLNHLNHIYIFLLSYTFALRTLPLLLILPHIHPPLHWSIDRQAFMSTQLDQFSQVRKD